MNSSSWEFECGVKNEKTTREDWFHVSSASELSSFITGNLLHENIILLSLREPNKDCEHANQWRYPSGFFAI